MNPILIDGDFVVQLRENLSAATLWDPKFDLRVLQTNRYAVYKTHLDYLRAGAKIIKTNTARATPNSLAKLGIQGSQITSVITTAVELAQKAVFKYYEETGGDVSNVGEFTKRRPLIAGNCSSYGLAELNTAEDFDYWNHIEPYELRRCHRMRMQALLNAGVDLLALEGITCRMEAEVIVDLLRQFRTARVWMSFVCCNEEELLDGNIFLEVAKHCYLSLPGQIVAIGVICPDLKCEMLLLENVFMNTFEINQLPMMMYFNERDEDKYETISYCVSQWISFGVVYISGSPKSSAEDIKLIHEALKYHSSESSISSEVQSSGSAKSNCALNVCSLKNEENKSKL